MIVLTWNTNGMTYAVLEQAEQIMQDYNPDAICLQEVGSDLGQLRFLAAGLGYELYSSTGSGKSSPGVATLLKTATSQPIKDDSARLLITPIKEVTIANLYYPFAGNSAKREKRQKWHQNLLQQLQTHSAKNLLICGDLNIASPEYKYQLGTAGFGELERHHFAELLDLGLVDTYMHGLNSIFPEDEDDLVTEPEELAEVGYRLDYILVPAHLQTHIRTCQFLGQFNASDHKPYLAEIIID